MQTPIISVQDIPGGQVYIYTSYADYTDDII